MQAIILMGWGPRRRGAAGRAAPAINVAARARWRAQQHRTGTRRRQKQAHDFPGDQESSPTPGRRGAGERAARIYHTTHCRDKAHTLRTPSRQSSPSPAPVYHSLLITHVPPPPPPCPPPSLRGLPELARFFLLTHPLQPPPSLWAHCDPPDLSGLHSALGDDGRVRPRPGAGCVCVCGWGGSRLGGRGGGGGAVRRRSRDAAGVHIIPTDACAHPP